MSIMRTITFPGDTEPREIQDNRIEIIILTDDSASMTFEQIAEALEEGKILKLSWNGLALGDFNLMATESSYDLVGEFAFAFSIHIPVHGVSDISPDFGYDLIGTIFITETNQCIVKMAETAIIPTPLESNERSVLTYDPEAEMWGWSNPFATQSNPGLVKAIEATAEMTEYIGIDANGQLRVAPSNDIETDETLSLAGYAADAQVVGNKLSSIPISIAEDGYTEINGLRQAVQIDISKTDTQVSIVTTLESGEDEVIQNSSIIALNASGLPIKITTNETECVINWGEGF